MALAALVFVAAYLLDEPLRRRLEMDMNRRLEGYSVRLGKLDFHPVGFSVDLEDLVVTQEANPDPPVLIIPRLTMSVQWSQILFGRLVSNFEIDRPRIFVKHENFVEELGDEIRIDEHGWQEAVQAIYPLQINLLEIHDGAVTYVDEREHEPLTLTHLDLRAGNIRNVKSGNRVYPSDVYAEAVVFEKGRLVIDGGADFLAKPHVGVKTKLTLDQITLVAFAPILRRFNLTVREGLLSASGELEYSPTVKTAELTDATIDGLDADYIFRPESPANERTKVALEDGVRVATKVIENPGTHVKIGTLNVVNGNVGLVNARHKPEYRLFLSDAALTVKNLSNRSDDGACEVTLGGKFMGAGAAKVIANFRPEKDGAADFDIDVGIQDTDMRTLNDLFRAHGRFDVAAGSFSFFSELRAKNGEISGYVKPLFTNLDIHDSRQDREKPAMKRLYERVIEAISHMFENTASHQVGTAVEIKGRLDDPKVNRWTTLFGLVENAFFKASTPGFEREAQGG